MTVATGAPGAWTVAAPCPVGDVATLLARLVGAGDTVALGVDFPLGLPRAYAARHAAEPDFPGFLRGLAQRPGFFAVCDHLADLTPDRPFYPRRGLAGMTRLAHAAALGLADASALSRLCDRATADRPAGAPLFWTLGAQPVRQGRHRRLARHAAARARPVRRAGAVAVRRAFSRAVAAGPGGHRGNLPGRGHAPTRPAHGRQQAAPGGPHPAGGGAARGNGRGGPMPDAAMAGTMAAGFGADAAGEDRFDSLLGLLCVVAVLDGRRPDTAPADPWVRRWEGWVLGQTAI